MKRTKQMQTVVDETNRYLRNAQIKDEGDPTFHTVMFALLETGTYRGFNYYKDMQIGDEVVPVLAGSCTNFEYLQLL